MKKKDLKSLKLNKISISNLNSQMGGQLADLAITPVTVKKTKCDILLLAITPITDPRVDCKPQGC